MRTLSLIVLALAVCVAAHRLVIPSVDSAADAIRAADLRSLRGFLARGTPAQACDAQGESLLAIAATNENLAAAEVLLSGGADPNRADRRGWTPLHVATIMNDKAMARLLIEGGADVNRATSRGLTPLLMAAQAGSREMMCWLLDHGADANVRSCDGDTPLHIVVRWENHEAVETVEALLAHGADPLAVDRNGATPLDAARNLNDAKVLAATLRAAATAGPNVANAD